MSELNGGSPSRNGTNPKKGEPEITLLIADRLDALERALGTVRRRGMRLEIQSLAREDGRLVLTFRGTPDAVIPDRWLAELGALVDVEQVRVSGLPAR